MRKWIAISLTVALLLAMAACAKGNGSGENPSPSEPASGTTLAEAESEAESGSEAGTESATFANGAGTESAASANGSGTESAGALPSEAPAETEKEVFMETATGFSIRLFQSSIKEGENTMISPTCVLNALAMTANGAGGETAKQMLDVIGAKDMKTLNRDLSWWNSRLVSTDRAKLTLANSIWLRDDFDDIQDEFLRTCQDSYRAQVFREDFASPQTVERINGWVSENTDGMIDEMIDEISPDFVLYLINATAFDAEWKEPYGQEDITEETFTTESGEEQTATFMYDDPGLYIEGERESGFIKPYADGYQFVALLPSEGISVKEYVDQLDGETFRTLVEGAQSCSVDTWLPKFSYDGEAELGDALAGMGMPTAFSNDADFSGISRESILRIDKVLHKTFIKVDEHGTQAGAATSVGIEKMSLPIDPKEVRLDRPFVYAIVDEETLLPVFIGTLMSVE